MFIVKTHKFEKDSNFQPIYSNVIYHEYHGKTLRQAMQAYRQDAELVDLSRFTAMHIYDVIDTNE